MKTTSLVTALVLTSVGAPLLAQSEITAERVLEEFIEKGKGTSKDLPNAVRAVDNKLIELTKDGVSQDCLPYALRVPGPLADDLGLRDLLASDAELPACKDLLEGIFGGNEALRMIEGATERRLSPIENEDLDLVARLSNSVKDALGVAAQVEPLPVEVIIDGEPRRVLRIIAPDGKTLMAIPTDEELPVRMMPIPTDPDTPDIGLFDAGLTSEDIFTVVAAPESGVTIENPCTPHDGTLGSDCLSSAVGIAMRSSSTAPCDLRGSGVIIDSAGVIALTAEHVSSSISGAQSGGMVVFAGNQSQAGPTRCPDAAQVVEGLYPLAQRDVPHLKPPSTDFVDWRDCEISQDCVEIDLAVLKLSEALEVNAADGTDTTRIPHHPILRAEATATGQDGDADGPGDTRPKSMVDGISIFGMAAGYGLDTALGAQPPNTTRGDKRRGFFRIGDCGIAAHAACEIGVQFPGVTAAKLLFEDGKVLDANACYFDSGAPVYVEMSDGSLAVVGLLRQRVGGGTGCAHRSLWVNLTNPIVQDWLLDQAAALAGVSRDIIEERVLTAPNLSISDPRPVAGAAEPGEQDRG